MVVWRGLKPTHCFLLPLEVLFHTIFFRGTTSCIHLGLSTFCDSGQCIVRIQVPFVLRIFTTTKCINLYQFFTEWTSFSLQWMTYTCKKYFCKGRETYTQRIGRWGEMDIPTHISSTFPFSPHALLWSYRISCAFDAYILSTNACYLYPSWQQNKLKWSLRGAGKPKKVRKAISLATNCGVALHQLW